MERSRKRFGLGIIGALIGTSLALGAGPGTALGANSCVAPGGAGGCSSTIQAALDAATAGDTITVKAGTYNENLVISKPVTLQGAGAATTVINANAANPKEGVIVDKVTSGATTITGFTIQNAALSAVLISDSSNVTVSNNVVENNDKNLKFPTDPTQGPSCAGAFPFDQDDCGEAIHLRGASNSSVLNNLVTNNAGGILLTDETGATHDNRIDGNTVVDNILDCGITLASHPSSVGPPASPGGPPSFVPGGGVFNNQVTNNTSEGNGAAGVGVFASVPGTSAYNNLVQGNMLLNNGIAGVSLHSHAPNQKLDNNQIIGNTIGTNNIFGDGDSGDFVTTGILVMGAVVPAKGTVITGNTITGNHVGIWLANTVDTTISGNKISAALPIVHASPPAFTGTGLNRTFVVPQLGFTATSTSSSFTVGFSSAKPGQGFVLFGTGPGCTGLVQVATRDQGAGTTSHIVQVTGNDLAGTIGDIGLTPGATYYYELLTASSSGVEVDNNGGSCYKVTVPAA
jgi:parallel beta-helix repeat protein